MTDPGTSDDPRRHAELVRLVAELRQQAVALAWAQRAGQPREVARLRREEGRLRRRIAHLRELLRLPAPDEGGSGGRRGRAEAAARADLRAARRAKRAR